jgi:hypothetical protein
MDSTGIAPSGRLTVTAAPPDTPLPSVAVAVIVTAVALADIPVTSPVESTVAADGLLDDQLTVFTVASAGKTAALNCTVEPVATVAVDGLTVIDVTITAGSVTVTVQAAVLLLPSRVVALTSVVPTPTAVTRPESLTVAKPGVVEAQDRAVLAVSPGATVAESCLVPPTVRLMAVSLRVRESASLGPGPESLSGQAEKSRAARTHQGAARRNREFLIQTPYMMGE